MTDPMPTAAPLPNARRAGVPLAWRAAYVLGVAALGLGLVAGMVQALRSQRSLPPAGRSYVPYVNGLIESGRYAEALHEMRIAALLDSDNPTVVMSLLPNMVRLARDHGTRDDLLFALRQVARHRPKDAAAHVALADALLGVPDPTVADLAEAGRQAKIATHLDASSAAGWTILGVAHLMAGRTEDGDACFRTAAALRRTQAAPSPSLPTATAPAAYGTPR